MEIIERINNMESPTASGLYICAIFCGAVVLMALAEVVILKFRK